MFFKKGPEAAPTQHNPGSLKAPLRPTFSNKRWEAADLANCPKSGSSRKWLGEGAKGLLDPASKRPLALVRNGVRCKRRFGWCKRLLGDLCSLAQKSQKDLLHPPLGKEKSARTCFAQTFRTPPGVRDIPAKFLGHPRFLSSKPKENKLSREGTNFSATTPSRGRPPPHRAVSGPTS